MNRRFFAIITVVVASKTHTWAGYIEHTPNLRSSTMWQEILADVITKTKEELGIVLEDFAFSILHYSLQEETPRLMRGINPHEEYEVTPYGQAQREYTDSRPASEHPDTGPQRIVFP